MLLSNTVPRLSNQRLAVARPLAAVFFYFIIAGIVTVMLGPLLPALIQRWHIQDSQAGTLFTATFAGQLAGAWFAARNLRFSVILGAILSAIGCAFMAMASFETAHFALFCVGVGLGAGLTAGNIIVGTAAPSSRGRLLAMLNVAWGLGAIACPLLVRASASTSGFFLIAATSLAIAGIFAISLPATLPLRDPSTSSRLPLPRLYLLVFAAAAFLYIGIENALGGWLPSYALRTNPFIQASSITLSFWIAELTGRLLIAALLSHLSETTLYRLCLALLLITQAALCATAHPSPGGIIAITFLSGLTLGPLYPLTLSLLFARTGNHPGLGPLFAVATVGGAILPWFTGIASTHFDSLRAGLAIPTVGVVAFLLLSAVITRRPLTEA